MCWYYRRCCGGCTCSVWRLVVWSLLVSGTTRPDRWCPRLASSRRRSPGVDDLAIREARLVARGAEEN